MKPLGAGSELVVLVFEQDVERGERSITARDILLQVELVCFAQFAWHAVASAKEGRSRSPSTREFADSFRETCRILPRRIRARIQSHQSKCRSSGSPSLGHPDLPLRLDPVDDQLRKGVAVALQHQHVAVAGDTEVVEVDEVGFSSVRVEPIDDRLVYRTRVTEEGANRM